MNKVLLTGRLTADVKLYEAETGKVLAIYTVACKQGKGTEFIDVISFNQAAKFIGEYGKKGATVNVEGHLQYRTTEKDGTKIYKMSVIGEIVELFAKTKVKDKDNEEER